MTSTTKHFQTETQDAHARDDEAQKPGQAQIHYRYSYVENNPVRYTDPTGYDLDGDAGIAEAVTYVNFTNLINSGYTFGWSANGPFGWITAIPQNPSYSVTENFSLGNASTNLTGFATDFWRGTPGFDSYSAQTTPATNEINDLTC